MRLQLRLFRLPLDSCSLQRHNIVGINRLPPCVPHAGRVELARKPIGNIFRDSLETYSERRATLEVRHNDFLMAFFADGQLLGQRHDVALSVDPVALVTLRQGRKSGDIVGQSYDLGPLPTFFGLSHGLKE